jgi:hypothetical protein
MKKASAIEKSMRNFTRSRRQPSPSRQTALTGRRTVSARHSDKTLSESGLAGSLLATKATLPGRRDDGIFIVRKKWGKEKVKANVG